MWRTPEECRIRDIPGIVLGYLLLCLPVPRPGIHQGRADQQYACQPHDIPSLHVHTHKEDATPLYLKRQEPNYI